LAYFSTELKQSYRAHSLILDLLLCVPVITNVLCLVHCLLDVMKGNQSVKLQLFSKGFLKTFGGKTVKLGNCK